MRLTVGGISWGTSAETSTQRRGHRNPASCRRPPPPAPDAGSLEGGLESEPCQRRRFPWSCGPRGAASGRARQNCPVPLLLFAPSPPVVLLIPRKPQRTLVLRVRVTRSLAFSGLNFLLGSPLCFVGEESRLGGGGHQWGGGEESFRGCQIPGSAKRGT